MRVNVDGIWYDGKDVPIWIIGDEEELRRMRFEFQDIIEVFPKKDGTKEFGVMFTQPDKWRNMALNTSVYEDFMDNYNKVFPKGTYVDE